MLNTKSLSLCMIYFRTWCWVHEASDHICTRNLVFRKRVNAGSASRHPMHAVDFSTMDRTCVCSLSSYSPQYCLSLQLQGFSQISQFDVSWAKSKASACVIHCVATLAYLGHLTMTDKIDTEREKKRTFPALNLKKGTPVGGGEEKKRPRNNRQKCLPSSICLISGSLMVI